MLNKWTQRSPSPPLPYYLLFIGIINSTLWYIRYAIFIFSLGKNIFNTFFCIIQMCWQMQLSGTWRIDAAVKSLWCLLTDLFPVCSKKKKKTPLRCSLASLLKPLQLQPKSGGRAGWATLFYCHGDAFLLRFPNTSPQFRKPLFGRFSKQTKIAISFSKLRWCKN